MAKCKNPPTLLHLPLEIVIDYINVLEPCSSTWVDVQDCK